jgi:hypothetical protein
MGKPVKAMIEGFSSSAVKSGTASNPALYLPLGSLILIVGPFLILIAPSNDRLSMYPVPPARLS